MRTSPPPLLPIFRSRLQGDLLARVLLGDVPVTVTDLAQALGAPVSTVHREVVRLEAAGLLASQRVGRTRLLSVREGNPAVAPLRQLVEMAFGPPQVVGEEFSALEGAQQVIVFGSWAARHAGEAGPPPGDVDVLVVGDPDRDDVFDAAERVEGRLRRRVGTTIVSAQRWQAATEPFLIEVRRRPHVVVVPERAAP